MTTPEQIKERYEERILAILNHYADAIEAAGYLVDRPSDVSCDVYQWTFTVHVDGNTEEFGDDDIGFDFKICESEYWDGEENGVNFMLDIVAIGGRILGGLAPYNYTDKVWVSRDDDEAIEERFKIMEEVSKNTDEVVEIVRTAHPLPLKG